ncbi:MAG: menaquinone biosynthesis family protein [Phycisphaerales bacterium]
MIDDPRPVLTLAHSPDPDDVFMWWPITGKIAPDGRPLAPPAIETGRFRYRSIPEDIQVLNRRARDVGDFDITAISFAAYPGVRERYTITACGASFGEGFGPKVVVRDDSRVREMGDLVGREGVVRIAIPGKQTTACMVLSMVLAEAGDNDTGETPVPRVGRARSVSLVEMAFEKVIPAVASGEVDAGVVIHEGQVIFEQAGLRRVVDLGEWWKRRLGLPLPLGANVIRRDLDARFGAGTCGEVERMLSASIEYALSHRREGLEHTVPYALRNATRSGERSGGVGEPPSLERIDAYVAMYVNRWTRGMGVEGAEAVRRLLRAGAEAGLVEACEVDVVGLDSRA